MANKIPDDNALVLRAMHRKRDRSLSELSETYGIKRAKLTSIMHKRKLPHDDDASMQELLDWHDAGHSGLEPKVNEVGKQRLIHIEHELSTLLEKVRTTIDE